MGVIFNRHRRALRLGLFVVFCFLVILQIERNLGGHALLGHGVHEYADRRVHLSSQQIWLANALRASLRKHRVEFSDEDVPEDLQESFFEKGHIERVSNLTARQLNHYLIKSTPVVITNATPCTEHKWTLEYIEKVAGHNIVGVETSRSNRFYANEGLSRVRMTVSEFLRTFRDPKRKFDMYLAEESMDQVPALRDDVVEPEASEVLNLDRLQLWIGAGGQVAPMHHDQWDNVLCQIEGIRTFYIFDPLHVDRLYPKPNENRHFSQVDPESKDAGDTFPLFRKARMYKVDVHPGEIMFLPAMWWHQVHHHDSLNIAVNFWYDTHIMAELAYDNVLPPGHFDE
eukprot:PhM_4_TR11268/c0_g1_i1/m.12265/K10277/KDM8, JMJD5; lysine-specific demethylase 8